MRVSPLWLWLALAGCKEQAAPEAPVAGSRPELALLTSLPVVFGEQFTLDAPKSPLLETLEMQFLVLPVDGPEQLKPSGLLLAVQPQALTAERLVALDRWVRAGGRMLLLADPALRWESSRPLGDRFRPPYFYPDTGLLAHWGLRLDRAVDDRLEAVTVDFGGGIRPAIAGMGRLAKEGGSCSVTEGGAAARCRIGRGRVTVVADADFAMSPEEGLREAVAALVAELSR